MSKFIISYGWTGEIDIIEAVSKDRALDIATARSIDDGMLDDDLADSTWAEEYTDDLAVEYGIKNE